MHVDLDLAAARSHAVEYRLPERVTGFFHPALAVNAERDTADLRNGPQQSPHCVAAVRTMRFGRQSFDRIVRLWARDPLIAVHPDAELEFHSARRRLLGDEAQHFEVTVALCIRQLWNTHLISGHGKQERIREKKIG